MKSGFERSDETLILVPRGRLSLQEGQEMLAAIFEEMEPLPEDVIVDLSGVRDMSSWGFALVCGLARKLALTGRRLRIAGPTPFVKKYLQLFTGLRQPMEFHKTRGGALRSAHRHSRGTNTGWRH